MHIAYLYSLSLNQICTASSLTPQSLVNATLNSIGSLSVFSIITVEQAETYNYLLTETQIVYNQKLSHVTRFQPSMWMT